MAEKEDSGDASDSPQSAANYVRRSAAAMRASGAGTGRRISVHRSEYRALIDWAQHQRKLVPFSFIEQFRPVAEGAEHVVYHDSLRRLAVKATHANRFGHSADGERIGATPLEYLRRLGWHNVLFGDRIRIEAIAYDDGQLELITSQPWIVTDAARPQPTRREIDGYFRELGFAKAAVTEEAPIYFNRRIGVIIADAHDQNILRDHQGRLVPIDVVIGRPGETLKGLIDVASGSVQSDVWPAGLS